MIIITALHVLGCPSACIVVFGIFVWGFCEVNGSASYTLQLGFMRSLMRLGAFVVPFTFVTRFWGHGRSRTRGLHGFVGAFTYCLRLLYMVSPRSRNFLSSLFPGQTCPLFVPLQTDRCAQYTGSRGPHSQKLQWVYVRGICALPLLGLECELRFPFLWERASKYFLAATFCHLRYFWGQEVADRGRSSNWFPKWWNCLGMTSAGVFSRFALTCSTLAYFVLFECLFIKQCLWKP